MKDDVHTRHCGSINGLSLLQSCNRILLPLKNSSGVAEVCYIFRQKNTILFFNLCPLSLSRAKQTSFQMALSKSMSRDYCFSLYLALNPLA